MDEIETTWICPHCSAEVASGLMNYANHRCEEDRPSESIAAHQREVEMQRKAKEEEIIWNLLWWHMTEAEKDRYLILSISGQIMGTRKDAMVLMSSEAMERLLQFKSDMIMKYL